MYLNQINIICIQHSTNNFFNTIFIKINQIKIHRTVRRTKRKVPGNNSPYMGEKNQQKDNIIFNFTNLDKKKQGPDQKKPRNKTMHVDHNRAPLNEDKARTSNLDNTSGLRLLL